ncbi:hypothetical protein ACFLRN_08885, partial [Thermoproteota archaeon]
ISLLAVIMFVVPAMAKGPINAVDKNPNAVLDTTTKIVPPPGVPVVDLNLPSEVTNRWFGDEVHVTVKPVGKFYNPTTLDAGDDFLMWLMNPDYRGKWVKMSQTGYLGLFDFFGLTPPINVPAAGVYVWGSK